MARNPTPNPRSPVDYLFLLSIAYFAWTLSGPSSVLLMVMAVAQNTRVSRVSYFPAYLTILAAVQAFRLDGLDAAYSESTTLVIRLLLLTAAVSCVVLDYVVFPLSGSKPSPSTGEYDTAVLEVGLPEAEGSIVRICFPTKADKKHADMWPYFQFGTSTFDGMASFLGAPAFLLRWLVYTRPWSFDAEEDTAPPAVEKAPFKAIVFSHGLSGTPDCYSGIIAELVSQGYLVAAVHHTDGSAAFAKLDDNTDINFEPLNSQERSHPEVEYKRRHAQLGLRGKEMTSVAALLHSIAARPWVRGAATEESADLQYARKLLHGKVNISSITAMGHSFGAATAILAAQQDKRFTACVLLDPWMFPLSAVTLSRGLGTTPVLCITGEGYRRWKANHVAVSLLIDAEVRGKYVRAAPPAGTKARAGGIDVVGCNGVTREGEVLANKFYVTGPEVHPASVNVALKGVEHASFNDFQALAPLLVKWGKMSGKRDPADVFRVVSTLSSQYITHVDKARKRVGGKGEGEPGVAAMWAYNIPSEFVPELYTPSRA